MLYAFYRFFVTHYFTNVLLQARHTFSTCQQSLSAYDHTSLNAPDTIRTRKLNGLGLKSSTEEGDHPGTASVVCFLSIFRDSLLY